MSHDDQADAWQKWVSRHRSRPHSYKDHYGNSIPDDVVEARRIRATENDPEWDLDFDEFLESLPVRWRGPVWKSAQGMQLTDSERVYLHRARGVVSRWLKRRSL